MTARTAFCPSAAASTGHAPNDASAEDVDSHIVATVAGRSANGCNGTGAAAICIGVHFLRHAEGTHNVAAREKPEGRSCDWVYGQAQHFDADLSPAAPSGEGAAASGSEVAARGPLKVPVVALEETREWAGGGHCCDGRHPLKEQSVWASNLFEHISFEPHMEADPLPHTMPREPREAVEGRCLLFLERLHSLVAREAASAAAPSAEGLSASSCHRCSNLRTNGLREMQNGSPSCKRNEGNSPLTMNVEVFCVSHSAWLRTCFALLSLYAPEKRGLQNCEWRSIRISLGALSELLPHLKRRSARPREISPFTALPFEAAASTVGLPTGSGDFLKVARRAADNHWTVGTLSELLNLRALQPLTIVVYPQWGPSGVVPEKAELLHAAIERIKEWILRQPVCTSHGLPPQMQQRAQHQQIEFAPPELQARRMLTDGTMCIRRLIKLQSGEPPLEIVEKERIHRENCLLLCLLPLLTNSEQTEAEVSLLSSSLLPTQAGAESCIRLDVLSLS
ncbi:phosphoglycerate mutase family protein [Cyclospora cayetanensis]|uniref:Phosphoglycerate mutase family protein n=1 Tax=Cyclospora cayetanensis TaxID=88456 RepID=A0A1D3DB69_9EIME|nr:phosphoglycerate mutase family protein [Cyclospora cayetanensis]